MINQLLGAFILSMKVDVTLFVLEKLEVPEHNPPASQPASHPAPLLPLTSCVVEVTHIPPSFISYLCILITSLCDFYTQGIC
jgi:hypothetical protein